MCSDRTLEIANMPSRTSTSSCTAPAPTAPLSEGSAAHLLESPGAHRRLQNIGEELEPRFGRKTDCFTFQPAANRRALRFFDVETAMASQTIYGDASVVERIREEARRILDETIDQLEQIRSHVKEIEQRWHGATERDLAVRPPILRAS